MTRRPPSGRQPRNEEAHAALARVFGVAVRHGGTPPGETTAPEPPVEEAERRAALGRVFGTEA